MEEARSPEQGALPLNQFEELLIGVRAPLYSFARSLLGVDRATFDVVQEALVDAWRATQRRQPPFTAEDNQAARRRRLFNVAYHKSISLRRHNRLIAWQSFDEAPEVERTLLAQQQIGQRYGA